MGQYLSATVPEETVGKPPSDKAFNQPQAQKEVDEDQEEQQEQEQEEEDLSLIQDKEHDGISSSTEDSPSSQGLETPKQNLLQQRFKALSLDPRSPSGLPRTPIVVEEEEVEQEDALSADLEEEDDKKTQSLKPKVVPKRNMIHDFRDVK